MKARNAHTYWWSKISFVVIILLSMGVQTNIKTLLLLPETKMELVKKNIEDSSEEEESVHEKDMELFITSYAYLAPYDPTTQTGVETQEPSHTNIYLEIILPPPDFLS